MVRSFLVFQRSCLILPPWEIFRLLASPVARFVPRQHFKKESKMDFATLTTSAVTAITAALTAIIPALSLIIGASVGYKLFRKFIG